MINEKCPSTHSRRERLRYKTGWQLWTERIARGFPPLGELVLLDYDTREEFNRPCELF